MKTAAELGITQAEFDALVVVRDALAADRLHHVQIEEDEIDHNATESEVQALAFNMDYAAGTTDHCGTVACIGGWMHAVMQNGGQLPTKDTRVDLNGMDSYVVRGRSDPLSPLFFPNEEAEVGCYSKLTSEQAAEAATNFLNTGSADWDEVIA